MDAGVFIALINPAMSLIFAATFFVLWRHRRQHGYIALIALSYVAIAVGFLLQYFTLYSVPASKLLSNLSFLAGGMGFAIGGLARFARKPPVLSTAVFAIGGFAAFAWYLFIEPDIASRVYAINFAFGAITLLMAAELRKAPARLPIDNMLLGLLMFYGIIFFVRPILVIWIEGPYESYEEFHSSLYWITLTFSASLFLLLFALSLITAIALEVMEELKRESQTDPLSGLLNRRGFEEGAAEALRTARRRQMPATLVICDLDHFKAVNDTWGHGGGDAVIATFAGCLRTCIGAGHIVGRIGGEEFAILLQGANVSTGRLFAEGARTAFGIISVPGLPEATRFTASFGVAEWLSGEDVAALFDRADGALYQAKEDGRDCVRIAPARLMPQKLWRKERVGDVGGLSGLPTR